ncbi:MAG: phage tail protein I [Rhodocyclaceae bacterium]|nr:phage tail protein I [Rhodocyclaceae bacterium]
MTDRLAPDVLALDARLGPLAEATARLERLPLEGLLTYLVDTVPASYLPELARQFHIMGLEGWRFAATDEQRRRLIREAIALHRKKGTPWAVKRALEIAGIDAAITEWWQQAPAGAPFAFVVDLAAGQPASTDAAAFADAKRHVDEWKPVSRHAEFRVAAASASSAAIAACGTALMQCHGAGELLAQPMRGASAHAVAGAGQGFLLMAASGTLQ